MITPRWITDYLHPGEQIIHLIQHSWIMFIGPILGSIIFAIIPIVALISFPDLITNLQASPVGWIIGILGGSLYYLGLLLFLLVRYVDIHLDFWIITNERLISIEQQALFNQRISEQELIAIQDITSEVKGIVATILNFGDIQVRTASERQGIIIDDVSSPHMVRRQLFQLLEQKRLRDQTVPPPVNNN